MVNEKFYKFDQILLASKHLEKKKKKTKNKTMIYFKINGV